MAENDTFAVTIRFKDYARDDEEFIMDRASLDALHETLMNKDYAFMHIGTVYGIGAFVQKSSVLDITEEFYEEDEDSECEKQGQEFGEVAGGLSTESPTSIIQ